MYYVEDFGSEGFGVSQYDQDWPMLVLDCVLAGPYSNGAVADYLCDALFDERVIIPRIEQWYATLPELA